MIKLSFEKQKNLLDIVLFEIWVFMLLSLTVVVTVGGLFLCKIDFSSGLLRYTGLYNWVLDSSSSSSGHAELAPTGIITVVLDALLTILWFFITIRYVKKGMYKQMYYVLTFNTYITFIVIAFLVNVPNSANYLGDPTLFWYYEKVTEFGMARNCHYTAFGYFMIVFCVASILIIAYVNAFKFESIFPYYKEVIEKYKVKKQEALKAAMKLQRKNYHKKPKKDIDKDLILI